jgi:16S rRNA (uracil1498-N3)-methyltransferase
MKRIFLNEINLQNHINEKIKLTQNNVHYLTKVLRLRNCEKILVFDGTAEAIAVLENEMIEVIEITRTHSPKPLKLAVGIIKQTRFEWLLEKVTELGVTEIFPLNTQFTQNLMNFQKLRTRFETIITEACKQSNRICVPILHEPIDMDKFINSIDDDSWVFGHIQNIEKNRLKTNTNNKSCGAIIGPEGGFSENEIQKLLEKCTPLDLSENILRTETASIIALHHLIKF